jgi:hypothetical protein
MARFVNAPGRVLTPLAAQVLFFRRLPKPTGLQPGLGTTAKLARRGQVELGPALLAGGVARLVVSTGSVMSGQDIGASHTCSMRTARGWTVSILANGFSMALGALSAFFHFVAGGGQHVPPDAEGAESFSAGVARFRLPARRYNGHHQLERHSRAGRSG